MKQWKTIGLIGRPRDLDYEAHLTIIKWLLKNDYNIVLNKENFNEITDNSFFKTLDLNGGYVITIPANISFKEKEDLAKESDVIIVIGGDGNFIASSRYFAPFKKPLLGVNKGTLGFLTDINPNELEKQFEKIFNSKEENFFIEKRFLLKAKVIKANKDIIDCGFLSMNEFVVHPSSEKRLSVINFDVFINNQFAFSSSSDGLIVATPTGSTAYSLSAGGSILSPNMDVVCLTILNPHRLSARPLIIDGNDEVKIKVTRSNNQLLNLTSDGQETISFDEDDEIIINKFQIPLELIHLNDYNYYKVLNEKLGWGI